MNDPAQPLYLSKEADEIWILFDCRVSGMHNRLRRERRAWGSRATVETLVHGCAALIVRPGGAKWSAA
jgi:hypothetical protein